MTAAKNAKNAKGLVGDDPIAPLPSRRGWRDVLGGIRHGRFVVRGQNPYRETRLVDARMTSGASRRIWRGGGRGFRRRWSIAASAVCAISVFQGGDWHDVNAVLAAIGRRGNADDDDQG